MVINHQIYNCSIGALDQYILTDLSIDTHNFILSL